MKVYHFHNGTGGGVLSVIKNLLRFSSNKNIENHIIHVVNRAFVPQYEIEPVEGAVSQQLYHYSAGNNFYHTCTQLAKFLPDDKAFIVAHDWIELGMASNLGLQNPVVQIVHGNYDYYYDLALKHGPVVDAYICISIKIFNSLKEKFPTRKDDIFHINFPAPPVGSGRKINDSIHLIYFVGNLKDVNKQFSTIVEIANRLGDTPENYFFTIAGSGMTMVEFFELWPLSMKKRVIYLGPQTNEEIIALLPIQDIFLLPSLAEGLPVSLVEAMKAGAVPLVTNWEGGVDELITPGFTGYYFKPGAAIDYAACIKDLHADRKLLIQLSHNCEQRANTLFDPLSNTKKYEDLFMKISGKKAKAKNPSKVYGSRLDHPFIPNFITSSIRKGK